MSKNKKKKDKNQGPIRIQLAIQGGGAKLVGLIAALEVVQERERQGVIKVTRIAATSAGAVAGALYAGGVDMSAVKEHLKHFDAAPLAPPGRLAMAWRLLRNQPILDPKPIRKSLVSLFEGKNVAASLTLKQFCEKHIPLYITATDVTNSKAQVRGPDSDTNLISAILDSTAVPFLFRVPAAYDAGAVLADGGVCENLPVYPLKKFEIDDGPIVAISFAPSQNAPEPPDDLVSYAAALVSAAIDNSVVRAKREVKWVLELALDIPSFSFKSSLDEGLKRYNDLKAQTGRFFDDFVEDPSGSRISSDFWKASEIAPGRWEMDLSETMGQIGWMYAVHHQPKRPRIARSQLIVTLRSLEENGESDSVTNIVELHAVDAPIYCYRFALTGMDDRTDLLHSDVDVSDPAGNPVKVGHLPMLDYPADLTSTARTLLVVFQVPIERANGPYTVRLIEEVQGFVRGLLDEQRKEDEAYISTKLATLDAATIVIHYPKSFGQLSHEGEILKQRADGQREIMSGCTCRKLTSLELMERYPAPEVDYETVGWTCDRVPAEAKFRVQLSIQ